jgi:Cu+-exporting ATPase
VIFVAYVSPFVSFLRPLHHTLFIRGVSYATALMCVLATIIQIFVGAPIFISGIKAIRFNGRANMDTLVAFSSSTAFLYSVVALIANIAADTPVDADDEHSNSSGTNVNGAWGEPVFESPAILIAIVRTISCHYDAQAQFRLQVVVGRWIEQAAKKRASSAIVSLSKSQPDEALLVKIPMSLPGDLKQLPMPSDAALSAAAVDALPLMMLQRCDVVRVHAGAVFPADGAIIAGSTTANEAMLTGESRAIPKPCGSEVIGGTSNLDAIVHVRVNKVAAESTLSSIVRLVQEAQSSKPPAQRAADAVSARFIPFIIIITLASFFVWLSLVLTGHRFTSTFSPLVVSILIELVLLKLHFNT